MRGLGGLLAIVLLVGPTCTRSKTKEHRQPAASAASTPNATLATAPSAASSAQSASPNRAPTASIDAASPDAAAPRSSGAASDTVHCKALGKRGLVPLGTIPVGDTFEPLLDLIPENGYVVAATYFHRLAKFTVTRLRRDGAPAVVVGSQTALGEPRSPVLTEDAVYFTRNRTLWRISRQGGEVTELAKGFSQGIGVEAGYIYGIDCDPKKPIDRMQRIAVGGGAIESLVEFDRKADATNDLGQRDCDYRSFISDGQALYAAHWNGRRIVRYSLADRTVHEFINKKPYPSRLHFVASDLVFQAATGIFRSPKASAEVKRVTELGQAPYGFIAANEQYLVIHDGIPYSPDEWTYILPWSTGKARKAEYFKALNPDETPPDTGVCGVALDDECFYEARQFKTSLVIYSRSLP